jgi:hypothetical protein
MRLPLVRAGFFFLPVHACASFPLREGCRNKRFSLLRALSYQIFLIDTKLGKYRDATIGSMVSSVWLLALFLSLALQNVQAQSR